MYRGVLKIFRDLGKIQFSLPDQLLTHLQPHPADILSRGELQMLVKQGRQIAGADPDGLCHRGNGQLLLHMARRQE